MIAQAAGNMFDWAAARRRRAWERISRHGAALQERALLKMVRAARETEFGREHGFRSIRSVAAYQERVPLGDYLSFAPRWTRSMSGEENITWPGRAHTWVKTSGTTAGDKCIPVTGEALASHRKG
ncbi:MAG TPA: GH3 auxin-responsive promoter family protein, partial [Candidatus Acidoferrum sp.]|nr:GH3 auxin-responsive promoter family protein [Candidatus Acidoferrum sp.]